MDVKVADWHMMPVCEGCDFHDICHGEAESSNTLSQVAYLPKSTRNVLLKFRSDFASSLSLPPPSPSEDSRVGTEIEDLHLLIKALDVEKIQKFEGEKAMMNGPTLASLKMVAPRIEATRSNDVVPTGISFFYVSCYVILCFILNVLHVLISLGGVNVDFPTSKEDVSIYISFLSNPETNSLYAWYSVHILLFCWCIQNVMQGSAD